jgi:hypothetical protein
MDKLPSIIMDTEFDPNGLAVTDEGLLVPAYVASQHGFNDGSRFTPREQLNRFYQALRKEAGVLPLCPFTACGEYLDLSLLENPGTFQDVISFWDDFNRLVGPVNYETLMPRSRMLIAILDGGPAIDDGVAAEISHYATEHGRPIIGIRSDFRLAENPAAPINPAVRYFTDQGPYDGQLFMGPHAYENALGRIAQIADSIKGLS